MPWTNARHPVHEKIRCMQVVKGLCVSVSIIRWGPAPHDCMHARGGHRWNSPCFAVVSGIATRSSSRQDLRADQQRTQTGKTVSCNMPKRIHAHCQKTCPRPGVHAEHVSQAPILAGQRPTKNPRSSTSAPYNVSLSTARRRRCPVCMHALKPSALTSFSTTLSYTCMGATDSQQASRAARMEAYVMPNSSQYAAEYR